MQFTIRWGTEVTSQIGKKLCSMAAELFLLCIAYDVVIYVGRDLVNRSVE